jgi:hypothetical protein
MVMLFLSGFKGVIGYLMGRRVDCTFTKYVPGFRTEVKFIENLIFG